MNQGQTIRQLLMSKDEVTLVDLDGKLLGRKEKFAAHEHPAQLHLAISVWLINSKGEVLLQKRSTEKIVGADWWANSVCGNVWPTETFFDCAHRRLKAELNISNIQVTPVYKFTYKAFCNETYGEHELDQVYVGKYEGEVLPNKAEVSEYNWVNFKKLVSSVALLNYTSPEQTLLQKKEELKETTKPVSVVIDSREYLLAPWTILMARNQFLIDAAYKIINN